MKTTQNKRTLNDILRYVKFHSMNGMLKQSMMTIAEATGYSNATVHRAINQLQVDGLIQVIPTKSQRKPNTICYLGPEYDEISKLLDQANAAVGNLYRASDEVKNIMGELQDIVALLEDSGKDYIELH